jgi:quercetin dioxygenase-like cupin family protein
LFVAPDAQYTVAEAHVAPVKLGNDSSWAKVLLDQTNTGNRAAAMSILSISGGLEVPMHRHTSAEVLYVLSGEGVIYGLDGAKKGTAVTAGSAIFIKAGTAHGFVHKGNDPIILVQLYAPGGPEARFRGKKTDSTTAVSAKEQKRRPRKFAKPLVVETSAPAPLSIAGGKADVRILFDRSSAGDDAAYLGTLSGKPGLEVPLHVHETSTELLYLIEGEGTMVVGDTTIEVQAGDAIQIPPGVWHSFKSGASALKALQYYTPSGPEQRFRGTAK